MDHFLALLGLLFTRGPQPIHFNFASTITAGCGEFYCDKMRVWVRTELLCIHFDGLKVKFDQWPIPLSTFQAMLIDRALEHFEDSNFLFVQEELNRFKNQARKIASLLRRRCRLFKKVDSEHPTEVTNLRNVEWDDEIYLSLGDWDGGYDTELVSTDDSDEDEIDSWLGWLLEGKRIL